MTKVELPRGGQVFVHDLALGVMRAEVVDEVPYAQVLARSVAHDDICTLRGGQPALLSGGETVTLISLTATPEGEPTVVLDVTTEHELTD